MSVVTWLTPREARGVGHEDLVDRRLALPDGRTRHTLLLRVGGAVLPARAGIACARVLLFGGACHAAVRCGAVVPVSTRQLAYARHPQGGLVHAGRRPGTRPALTVRFMSQHVAAVHVTAGGALGTGVQREIIRFVARHTLSAVNRKEVVTAALVHGSHRL